MKQVKRLICFGLLLALLIGPFALAAPVGAEAEDPQYEYETLAETLDLTYIKQMMQAALNGDEAAGAAAEVRWNRAISAEEVDLAETAFFETYETTDEIAVAIANYLIAAGITELDGEPLQFRSVASSQNLRDAPERDAERVGSFPHGTIVTVLGRDADGWLQVTDGALTGWSSALHLAPFDGSPNPILPVVSLPPGAIIPAVVRDLTENGTTNNTDSTAAGGDATGGQAAPSGPTPGGVEDDLFWLALTIQMEAGSNWICDEHQLWVGNVVLNRVAHSSFPPTTIHGIVHQRGQYPWAASGARMQISERAFANAQRLLNGERFAPANVVFQAQFPQGDGTARTFSCDVSGNIHYFGYLR